jgi:hypothetical protein
VESSQEVEMIKRGFQSQKKSMLQWTTIKPPADQSHDYTIAIVDHTRS